ncbi:MAG: hypothetical protein H7333_03715 [Bdellovibrionales bacterium]|nr:hypothetical protein [Oligoflexia bacterium]
MGLSTDSYLKYGVGILFTVILLLSALILAPEDKNHDLQVATTKDFGAFISKNPQLVVATSVSEPQKAASIPNSPSIAREAAVTVPSELSSDQSQALSEVHKDWSRKGMVRDGRWRSQVDGLFDLAEKTGSDEVLDHIRPEIIKAQYDSNPQNHDYARVLVERYLRIEKRDFQRKQMQDLLLK